MRPSKNPKKGKDGESASGGIIERVGKITTSGSVDGKSLNIDWNVMDVTVPIISVRRLTRDGNDVGFRRRGGTIRNRKTGERLPLFEHRGVYYIKYKIKDAMGKDGLRQPVFSRPVVP